MPDPSLVRFRSVVAAACAELERRRIEVNDLNVFPVPDGDTGDNMVLTLRAVLDELDQLADGAADGVGREGLVGAVVRAALLGARGNSGVILSQIVRGAAEELASRPGELIDPVLLSAAFARAADAAYDAVRQPAEGTMLTAMRAMARRVAREAAHAPARGGAVGEAEQEDVLAWVLERALEAGREAVANGPEQLPVLARAGVVDAGAHGLLVILDAVLRALRGDDSSGVALASAPSPSAGEQGGESSRFRYCTNFAVIGEGLEPGTFVPALEALGDSVLVVGGAGTLRVHVHTDAPERATALFGGVGEVARLDVADMREQEAARSARLIAPPVRTARCAAVALADGAGARRLLQELGAQMLATDADEGAVAHALSGLDSAEVVVVAPPRSASALRAALAASSRAPVELVAAPDAAAMLAMLVAFDSRRPAAANAQAMGEALEALRLARVGPSTRGPGEAVGLVGEEEVARGTPADALATTVAAVSEGAELLVVLRGAEAPLELAALEALVPDGVALDAHEGGQRDWWWLLCAE